MMDVGALRHLVTLETPSAVVSDGDSGYTHPEPWPVLGQVWAEIKPATPRDLERVAAGTVISTASHLVTIRYLVGVTTQTRVRFGIRKFSVVGVMNPEERNQSLTLMCVEIVQ